MKLLRKVLSRNDLLTLILLLFHHLLHHTNHMKLWSNIRGRTLQLWITKYHWHNITPSLASSALLLESCVSVYDRQDLESFLGRWIDGHTKTWHDIVPPWAHFCRSNTHFWNCKFKVLLRRMRMSSLISCTLHTIEVPGPRFSVTNCTQASSKHHKSIGLSHASLDYRNWQHDGSGSSYIHFIM